MDITETTHLSFCAGYGGIDLGLQRVLPSCRTVAYVEIEAFAIANLVAKMEAGELDQAPIWTDVKTFPAEQFHGLVDIVSGGYPCQPFSAAGKRLGTEDPRHLWPFLRGAVRAIRPSRVFFENVEGHISLGLSTVLSDLDEDGYDATWGIFSAAEVGAPHQRKRVFILGGLPDACGRRLLQVIKHQLADTAGERDREPEQGIPVGNQRLPRRQEGSADVGGRLQEELADSKSAGLERQRGSTKISRTVQARPMPTSRSCEVWPARPGEPQYDWEEPRTVADPKSGGTVINEEAGNRGERIGGGSAEPCGLPDETRKDVSAFGDANRRQAEPQLGRTADGRTSGVDATTSRVDRLRLLGNGVVPATAAKAWIELSGRFE